MAEPTAGPTPDRPRPTLTERARAAHNAQQATEARQAAERHAAEQAARQASLTDARHAASARVHELLGELPPAGGWRAERDPGGTGHERLVARIDGLRLAVWLRPDPAGSGQVTLADGLLLLSTCPAGHEQPTRINSLADLGHALARDSGQVWCGPCRAAELATRRGQGEVAAEIAVGRWLRRCLDYIDGHGPEPDPGDLPEVGRRLVLVAAGVYREHHAARGGAGGGGA